MFSVTSWDFVMGLVSTQVAGNGATGGMLPLHNCRWLRCNVLNLPPRATLTWSIFTGRNEVVAKVIFLHLSVIHTVHRGVYLVQGGVWSGGVSGLGVSDLGGLVWGGLVWGVSGLGGLVWGVWSRGVSGLGDVWSGGLFPPIFFFDFF